MAQDNNDINQNQPPTPPNMEEMMKRFEEEMSKQGKNIPPNTTNETSSSELDVFSATEPATQIEHQVRSDSYNDFVSIQPKFFERFGVLLIALFIALILAATCFISYPEVIKAEIKVQSVNAPKALVTKVNGKVIKILKKNNDNVKKGEHVLYIESTAKHEEVIEVYSKINLLINALDKGINISKKDSVSQQQVAKAKNISEAQGLFYTIQTGVFSTLKEASVINNLSPIYIQENGNGTTKYYAGIYNSYASALEGKTTVSNFGITDAFIKAFNNGKNITIEEAKKLENIASITSQPIQINTNNLSLLNLTYTQLGELQSAFQTFKNSYLSYLDYQTSGVHDKKKNIILSDLDIYKKLLAINNNQKSGASDELKLVEEKSTNNQQLLNNEVIAKADYVEIYLNYLSKKNSMYQYDLTSLNYASQMNQKLRELMEIEEQAKNQEYLFSEAVRTLKSQFDDWINKYIITAPENGKLSYSTFIQENQMVETGKTIAMVVPDNNQNFVEMYITQNSYPKIKLYQSVLLKFPSFPSQDYGYVKGYVSFISPIASDSTYLAKVNCPEGFKTNQKINLNVKHGMSGVGEIIIKDKTIMGRIISKFTEKFK